MAVSLPTQSVDRRPHAAGAAQLAVFTCALFVSALLLFAIQPMFTKLVLPRLGGSPAVWSVAMVFFQGMLLAGYGYAHLLVRLLRVRTAAGLHLLLLIGTALALPISVAAGWGQPPNDGQALWLIGLFTASVGLPFFAVASTGPLLQAWFAQSGHRHAADPYFLYGASNLGSFAALILYPILFEPLLTLKMQSFAWSFGFIGLVGLIGVSALVVLQPADAWRPRAMTTTPAPTWRERATWTTLAMVPAALLVAVTAHISTDIAAAPFLWIVPLALYLLTFVVAFQRKPVLPHRFVLRALPFAIAPVLVLLAGGGAGGSILLIVVHLAFFFVAALACHGEMVRLRPPAERLTEFYLWMSTGGVIGGIFAGLIAPHVFSTVAEYPILVAASLIALPGLRALPTRAAVRQFGIGGAIIAVALVPAALGWRPDFQVYVGALLAAAALVIGLRERPMALLASAIGVLMVGGAYQPQLQHTQSFRSFFGVNKVAETADGRFRVLIHGTTVHGAQRIRNDDGTDYAGPPQPTTYYSFGGPLSQMIAAAREARGGLGRVASVGLGTGSLACHARAGEDWRFYEIDAEVVRIARDPALFGFLATCAPDAPVVIGDARLTLADEPDGSFDLIVLDAFSSDAVPVHLLTREALAGYFAKLAPGGVLAFHISNQYMDLAPVVTASAAGNGLTAYIGRSASMSRDPDTFVSGSIVAAVAADARDLGPLTATPGWTAMTPDPTFREWTDDYSNVLDAIVRRMRSDP